MGGQSIESNLGSGTNALGSPMATAGAGHSCAGGGRTLPAIAIMLLAVAAVYVPIPSSQGDNTLVGFDYLELHLHRIRFAQEALWGAHPHLPAWYPRELMGTPFWSNIQNFPFLPTRLLLLGLDPLHIYAVAVNLAAALAALFTFLYGRRIGLSRMAAAASGWTFACAGFFASRVMAGHLPLLEAYPALPLLLWLVERCRDAPAGRRGWRVLAIGLACGCLALAGHPQLPVYAMAAAAAYALWRVRGWGGVRIVMAMGAGVLSAAFALWPMWLLTLRSTRLLALDAPANDIVFPYRRLLAFVSPWSQGWPAAVPRLPHVPLVFPSDAYFWDTVCYVGLLPLLAVAFLLVRTIARRRLPSPPWMFIACIAVGGLLLALPAARTPFAHLPGTVLRSPARLLYFTSFGLALALGAAADVALAWAIARRKWWIIGALAVEGIAHGVDLGFHDRHFVRMTAVNLRRSEADEAIARQVGDGRVAIDHALWTPLNRQLDDVGFFDSIALARPYAAILNLSGKPANTNTQFIDGPALSDRALAACGVRVVISGKQNDNSNGGAEPRQIVARAIPDAAYRAAFFPKTSMVTVNSTRANRVTYHRDTADEITIEVRNNENGSLRVLEAWDPGWNASEEGGQLPVAMADDTWLAVPLGPGSHKIRLTYVTPGATAGIRMSLLGVILLTALSMRRRLSTTLCNSDILISVI
ncbi:MAG: Bacterial rane protein YfhO [Phycisphaerales bacterium]|nr:Bacterial rane protein YfhO [Phycisphaerales bacterium]